MSLDHWDKVSRDSSEYKTCLVTSTGAGAIVGSAVGSAVPIPVLGTVSGYAGGAFWGFVFGYLACPYIAPAVKKKIENGMSLTDSEVRAASEAMGLYADLKKADDAIKLLALIKSTSPRAVSSQDCSDPKFIAQELLRKS